MRKLVLNLSFGILAALACTSYALAAFPPPICQKFEGTLTLSIDPACQILTRSDTRIYFPDLLLPNGLSQFLGVPGTCFTGTITNGKLDNRPVTGTSYSGQTTHNLESPAQFSAATTLVLTNPNESPIGNIYFRDAGLFTDAAGSVREQLVVVGANGLFWGVKGTVQIAGNEFIGAPVTGQFCR
ncbi:MAG TPA: hypothetical protein PLD30_15860 [Candidatus Competibacteraceae bacterium]|nr:hypothetical protein [Candidatus Competibacteraceae bacterium]